MRGWREAARLAACVALAGSAACHGPSPGPFPEERRPLPEERKPPPEVRPPVPEQRPAPAALTDAAVVAIVEKQLGDAGAGCREVRWDTALRPAGATVPDGPGERTMPFDGYFVFVDLMPEANWGHPALYLLVTSDGRRVEVAHREFPPYADDYPASFRKLTIGACGHRP